MRKIIKKIHLWISVPVGLIITLTCLSGAILVFEDEITEAVRRDQYYVQNRDGHPLPIDRLISLASQTLPDSVSITGVTVSSDPQRAYQLNLSQPRKASIMVDQYTGEVKGMNQRTPFFQFVFRLHRWLLDNPKQDGSFNWGRSIVGFSTILFIFILISGLFIWIPRSRKALRNRLSIKTNKGKRRFWYDLHVSGGFYALLFLLAMAITGPTWSFPWYRSGFYKVFGLEAAQPGPPPQRPSTTSGSQSLADQPNPERGGDKRASQSKEERGAQSRNGINQRQETSINGKEGRKSRQTLEKQSDAVDGVAGASWNLVLDELKRDNQDYRSISVSSGKASVSLSGYGNQRAADNYTFDPRSGKITGAQLYKDTDLSARMRGWIWSVHVGSWGGLLMRIIYCLVALFGASLPLTGYYLWIKRKW